MRNTNKKGFTIVELVIVIAVIAILAAVLIPTFAGIIAKANQSADQHAVTQMNTILTSAQATNKLIVDGNDAETSINIYKALIAEGFSYEFDAYYEKYSFGYVVENGYAVIVLVEDGKVAYPKNHEGKTDYKQFFTAVEKSEDLLAAFDTGYVLLKTDAVFAEAIKISNDLTIVGNNKLLDEAHLTYDSGANSTVSINGATEDITVNMSGITIENAQDTYARGLNLGGNTGKVTLVLDNVNIESYYYALNIAASNEDGVDIIVRNSTLTGWAALNVWSKSNITFENCTLIGDSVTTSTDPANTFATIMINDGFKYDYPCSGEDSVLTFKNCTIETYSEAEVNNMRHIIVNVKSAVTFDGCTFKVNGATVSEMTKEVVEGATVTVK